MKKAVIMSWLFLLAGGWLGAQETGNWQVTRRGGSRFVPVDVMVDSKTRRLAAYQLVFSVKKGDVKIVSIEGGEHAAFREPPYYDPKAIQRERVVIAAFNTGSNLPQGKTRVATIHVQVTGDKEPVYAVKLATAAGADGEEISADVKLEERKSE